MGSHTATYRNHRVIVHLRNGGVVRGRFLDRPVSRRWIDILVDGEKMRIPRKQVKIVSPMGREEGQS